MANLTETGVWAEGVYQVEQTDIVIGGPGGNQNKSAVDLANRTAWLKNEQKGFNDITIVSASKTLTFSEVFNRLVVYSGAAAGALVLPTLSTAYKGFRIFIQNNSTKIVTITAPVGIILDLVDPAPIVIYPGEKIDFVYLGTKWLVFDFIGNLLTVGNTFLDYKQRTNTIVCEGQTLLRVDFPRLWAFVSSLGGSLLSESVWLSSANNKGFFSTGNGTTNFRVPDLRGMFFRSLDLGAGISSGRTNSNPGGYEPDEFKAHNHLSGGPKFWWQPGNSPSGDYFFKATDDPGFPKYTPFELEPGTSIRPAMNSYTEDTTGTANNGGTETRAKNIGLIPLMKV